MKYPFKFLDAYDHNDKDIFFGRDEEIEALYKMVFQTNLMLVYGASGTGKTSLIRCGLANKFKPSQWLDLYIRRGENINESLLETIQQRTPQAVTTTTDDEDDWFEDLIKDNDTPTGEARANTQLFESQNEVAQALNDLYLATFTPIYLIFDQFEEVFTLGEKAEQEAIIQTIEELVQLQLPVKIIIAIREEYLAKLYDLEQAIPQLRNKRLRIEPMNIPRVESIILNATNHELTAEKPNKNANITLQKREEKAIAAAIVNKIRENDVDIQLPYLQVFMDRLYEEATGEPIQRTKTTTLTLNLVNSLGKIGDILVDFINRQSQVIRKTLNQKYRNLPDDIIWNILSPFATGDGTKKPIQQHNFELIETSLKNNQFSTSNFQIFIRDAITELERSRILRFRRESQTYEVYHDTLAKQIAEKRSEDEKAYLKAKRIVTDGFATYKVTNTLLNKEQLAFVKPYEERIKSEDVNGKKYIEDSEKRIKRQQFMNIAVVVVLFIIGGLYLADTQRRNTELKMANLVIRDQQKETQAALAKFKQEEKDRRTKNLQELLSKANIIVKDRTIDNCPPQSMLDSINVIFNAYESNQKRFKTTYEETMKTLRETECID